MSTRTLLDYIQSLPSKLNPNGTEQSLVNDAGTLKVVPNQSYQVVNGIADLPASISVGVQILTRDSGTMWRGLVAGESSLPAGTPWPVKGYKEYLAYINQFDTDNPIPAIIQNTTGSAFTWTREFPGSVSINSVISPALQSAPIVSVTDSYKSEGIGEIRFCRIAARTTTSVNLQSVNTSNTAGDLAALSNQILLSIRIYPPAPTP
jgi:hypothetical protein